MMEAKHSPAPWSEHNGGVQDADGQAVCYGRIRNPADATLIISAPDLLDRARQDARIMHHVADELSRKVAALNNSDRTLTPKQVYDITNSLARSLREHAKRTDSVVAEAELVERD